VLDTLESFLKEQGNRLIYIIKLRDRFLSMYTNCISISSNHRACILLVNYATKYKKSNQNYHYQLHIGQGCICLVEKTLFDLSHSISGEVIIDKRLYNFLILTQGHCRIDGVRSVIPKRWSKKHSGVVQQGKKKSFTSAEGCNHRQIGRTHLGGKSTQVMFLTHFPVLREEWSMIGLTTLHG
jgi:hypothetical protein